MYSTMKIRELKCKIDMKSALLFLKIKTEKLNFNLNLTPEKSKSVIYK